MSFAISLCNELLLKNLLKRERPKGSCLTTYGAPSSHACFSMAWMGILLLEGYAHRKIMNLGTWRFESIPDNVGNPFNSKRFNTYAILLILFHLPVLPSRVILQDHTDTQVLTGGIFGIWWSLVAFFVMHRYGRRFLKRKFEGKENDTWMGFKDDYCKADDQTVLPFSGK